MLCGSVVVLKCCCVVVRLYDFVCSCGVVNGAFVYLVCSFVRPFVRLFGRAFVRLSGCCLFVCVCVCLCVFFLFFLWLRVRVLLFVCVIV